MVMPARQPYGRTASLALALVCACLREPPPPSFDDAAIAAACADQARAVCSVRTACSYMDMDYNVLHLFSDDATCESRLALTCINNLHVVDTSQTAARAETCAQSYSSDTCPDFFDNNLPSRCVAPSGPGAEGSPCTGNAQCESTFCEVHEFQSCGTCEPLPSLGSPCQINTDCDHDIDCVIPAGATQGTCTAYAGDSMPCLTGVAPCESTEVCVGDNIATAAMGTCHPGVRTAGAACDTTRMTAANCDPTYGLACIVATGTVGTCQPIQLAAAGSACGTLGSGSAKALYNCGAGGLCVRTPPTAATGACVAPAADGAPCSTDSNVGPPCLMPAICAASAGSSSGICTVPDPAACF